MSDQYPHAPEMASFEDHLRGMSDAALADKCRMYIWLSAYADNNPRSAYHWKCGGCYDEAMRRQKLDIYDRAYKAVAR